MKIEKSINRKDGIFINPGGNVPIMSASRWDTLKELFFGTQLRVPGEPLEVMRVNPAVLGGGDETMLRVTWLGHSSVIIEIEGKLVLADPVFSARPSPVPFLGPRRYHAALPLKPEDFPPIDLVIISHDHYDHLDCGTIRKIHRNVGRFVVPLGVGDRLEKWGVDPGKITELDWWEATGVVEGLTVAATPAKHFSGRGIFDAYRTLWASWVIAGKNRRVFFSGDTAYHPLFAEIGSKYGPFDITIMENGQYNWRWEHVHMLPEQSLRAHLELRGDIMLPVHWGAYNLSLHDWFEPVERLIAEAKKHGARVATPRIGETVTWGGVIPVECWWRETQSPLKSFPTLLKSPEAML